MQPNKSVHGYDIRQNREFVITATANADIYALASDGQTLAWTGQQSIRGYDQRTGKEFPLVDVSPPRAIGDVGAPVALANGVLYYADVTIDEMGGPNEGSIYAYNLATKTGKKLIEHGRNPVVKDGVLLWSHVEGPNGSRPNEMTLHALKLDGSLGDTVLSTGLHSFSGYDVAGDNAVWAGFGAEAQVYLYNLKTGQRQALSGSGGLYPLIQGDRVVWTEEPHGGLTGGAPSDWSIRVYSIARGTQTLVTQEHADWVRASALTAQSAIGYVKGAVYREIYLISLP